jgi:hypothetical protein
MSLTGATRTQLYQVAKLMVRLASGGATELGDRLSLWKGLIPQLAEPCA